MQVIVAVGGRKLRMGGAVTGRALQAAMADWKSGKGKCPQPACSDWWRNGYWSAHACGPVYRRSWYNEFGRCYSRRRRCDNFGNWVLEAIRCGWAIRPRSSSRGSSGIASTSIHPPWKPPRPSRHANIAWSNRDGTGSNWLRLLESSMRPAGVRIYHGRMQRMN